MIESIIFMILSFIGIIGFIISIIVLLIGLIRKSRKLKMTGIVLLMIPVFCYGIIQFWYKVIIPNSNENISEDFVGVYSTHKIKSTKFLKRNGLYDKERFLKLKGNGTYEFDTIPGVGLWKKGRWESGGMDGVFNFYDENGNLIEWGSPSGSGNNCGISFEYNPTETNKENLRILLKKIELK